MWEKNNQMRRNPFTDANSPYIRLGHTYGLFSSISNPPPKGTNSYSIKQLSRMLRPGLQTQVLYLRCSGTKKRHSKRNENI